MAVSVNWEGVLRIAAQVFGVCIRASDFSNSQIPNDDYLNNIATAEVVMTEVTIITVTYNNSSTDVSAHK